MEQILFALIGASNASGEPRGFLSSGMAIPLAATPEAREVIEAIGEDEAATWLADQDIDGPHAGGLWVIELKAIAESSEAPQGYAAQFLRWRMPTDEEVRGILARQFARSKKDWATPKPIDAATWTFLGAQV